jgi:hypothetical protein
VRPAVESIQLSAEHFAAATWYLIAGAVGLMWISGPLAAGDFLSPHVAGVTHLFTLGWLTTTIFGALYQLLPVALGAPIRWRGVAHASFWSFAPGVGFLAAGLARGSPLLHNVGLTLVSVGIVLAMTNVISALRRAPSHDVTWAAIALASAFLLSTLFLGAILLQNQDYGFIAAARTRVLATHLHVAIVGWVLIMMAGVAHRLLPMFLLAHNASTRWTKLALWLLATGVVVLAIGLNTHNSPARWIGVALLDLGVVCFARQAYAFYRVRVRKRLDVGMRFARASIVSLLVAAALGSVVAHTGLREPRIAVAYVVVGLLGGVVLFVVGFFYKIVPLLTWTSLYRDSMGKAGVPTVAELYSERIARIQLGVMPAGVAVLAAGILAGSRQAASVGSALFLIGTLLFTAQIVAIARAVRRSRITV